ncbi:MAG: fumarylacetoacetate hydrolase family protein [Verrucomicrobia bacterium]|nr:fumarylacetoacetate hydrolase family protein [Verrucomicrobiota bacterium]
MKLYSFQLNGKERIGVLIPGENRFVDLSASNPQIAQNMLAFIQAGQSSMDLANEALDSHLKVDLKFEEVRLIAPLTRPGKILCSGINYRSHLKENPRATLPKDPFFFAKMPSAVTGPGETIKLPKGSEQVDYEIELAVIMGKAISDAPPEKALQAIFGYTILNDVSARDVQFKENQITLGKNFDTFCPIGPCIVTGEELRSANQVRLRTYLNGEIMQNGSTADWLFDLGYLLSFLSKVMTLLPGDIISTGTPAGVGLFRNPPVFLKSGDVVRLEAEGIGVLENRVSAA